MHRAQVKKYKKLKIKKYTKYETDSLLLTDSCITDPHSASLTACRYLFLPKISTTADSLIRTHSTRQVAFITEISCCSVWIAGISNKLVIGICKISHLHCLRTLPTYQKTFQKYIKVDSKFVFWEHWKYYIRKLAFCHMEDSHKVKSMSFPKHTNMQTDREQCLHTVDLQPQYLPLTKKKKTEPGNGQSKK